MFDRKNFAIHQHFTGFLSVYINYSNMDPSIYHWQWHVTLYIHNWRGPIYIGVFLDFSKAFDTVNHTILLQKLHKYGICGVELLWFEDYLSNRMQYVTYNNHKSSREKNNCGVPQGSILGPILFLLYINDLASVSEFCFSVLFADDTNMFITGKDMNALCRQLSGDLRNIQEWLQCNKLSLNVLKTHHMVFTPRNKLIDDIEVKIHDVQIQRVYTTKLSGSSNWLTVNLENAHRIHMQEIIQMCWHTM